MGYIPRTIYACLIRGMIRMLILEYDGLNSYDEIGGNFDVFFILLKRCCRCYQNTRSSRGARKNFTSGNS